MRKIYFAACAAISCVALVVAVMHVDAPSVVATLGALNLWQGSGAVLALLLGALIAGVRLQVMAADVGTRLSLRDAIAGMAAGQIAGALTVQFFGQIAARGAVLGHRGFSLPTNIVVSAYERAIALAVGASLALLGAWLLFGKLAVDMRSGGSELAHIAVGICAATVGGAALGWGKQAKAVAMHISASKIVAVLRSTALTLAIHGSTAAAYVIAARALAPDVPLLSLISASLVVMFVASLPISFAGWGVREISAVAAFGAVGVSPEAALAISILIGLCALGVVAVIGAASALIPSPHAKPGTAGDQPLDIMKPTAWLVSISAVTLVAFQIYVPTRSGVVNVNPADVLAILGGILFVASHVKRGWPAWRLPALNVQVAAAAGVILYGLSIGIARFGVTDWALINKGFGFLILLGYAATGALIVVYAGDRGRSALLLTFLGSLAAILLISLALIVAGDAPHEAMKGFSQNRNAFAFMLVLSFCLLPFLNKPMQAAWLGAVLLGVFWGASRAAFGCTAIGVAAALYLHVVTVRTVAMGVFVAVCGFLIIAIGLAAPTILDSLLSSGSAGGVAAIVETIWAQQPSPDVSNTERLYSVEGGLRLLAEHPIFGAGLGAFMNAQTRAGVPLVIHSTPIWIAAEMGIVGFAIFASIPVRIFLYAWRDRDSVGNALILLIIMFATFSLVHDVMYQRSFWLILGALLAVGLPRHNDKTTSDTRA